jgi:hypothetical protein
MDLIYCDENKVDIGVLQDFKLDLAFGEDENNFELTMPLIAHCLEKDYNIYIEGTEYGGVIDSYQVNTELRKIVYKGRTWHGIFDSKVITPASGQDYYVISGDANTILSRIITEYGLNSLFTVPSEASGIVLPSTNVDRYKNAYTVLLKIFRNNGGKLLFSYLDGVCTIQCVPLVDYSQDEEFDSDQLSFVIEKNFNAVNHLICLGKGELKDRQRLDLYADANGNISTTQTLTGLDEITEVYDYSSVESLEELENEGRKEFASRRKDGKIEVTLTQTQNFDISDIIGATELVTGISVTKHISKKIVTIENDRVKVDYNVNG